MSDSPGIAGTHLLNEFTAEPWHTLQSTHLAKGLGIARESEN